MVHTPWYPQAVATLVNKLMINHWMKYGIFPSFSDNEFAVKQELKHTTWKWASVGDH